MRRKRSRMTWILLLSALGAFALAMGYRWLERGGIFDLDTIRIRGIRSQDSTAVCQVVAPLFGTSIWRLDEDSVAGELVALQGIRGASIRRLPLRGILITMELERPVFAIRDTVSTYAVSHGGQRLPASFISDTIPLVEAAVVIDRPTAGRLARWLEDAELQQGVCSMTYSEDGLSVILEGGCRVLLGNLSFARAWDDFNALALNAGGLSEWDHVDMRFAGQAVLRNEEQVDGQDGEGS